ncbi:MAG: ABC transporter ATP-binding protein [Bacteroidota bacterium]
MTKSFSGKDSPVIKGIDLELKTGTIVSILGESGCGKTTLARLVAGLETPDTGVIKLQNTLVADSTTFIQPQNRHIGMVFQDYALFPHLNVGNNITYGIAKESKKENRVDEVLRLVGLDGYKNRFPHQLSGGQQQRVALARALAPRPQLLILDEPFSNLDASLKLHLRNEIFDIIKKSGVTALFLTHDTQDAMAVADEIVVLKSGRIEQYGNAKSLYEHPKNAYVASLFGPIALLQSEDVNSFDFPSEPDKVYAIRQGHFLVSEAKAPYRTKVKIDRSIFLGNHYLNTAMLPNGKVITFSSATHLEGKVLLGFTIENLMIFNS